MSVAKTAAAIGLNITANPTQANKALAGLNQSLAGTQVKAEGLAAELREMSVNGLERMTFGMGRAAVSTAKWGVGLGALSATAAAVGFVDMAKDFATSAATMGRSADMMGIPVTKLSQFSIAAHLAGSSAEAMQAGLTGLQNTVSDAAFSKNNDAVSAFHAIGIDPGDGKRGAAKDYLEMLPKIADETERLAKTNVRAAEHYLDLTGVGRNLFPVMRHGAAGLQGYLNDAKKNYHLINDSDVDKGRDLEKVLAGISEQFTSFAQIGGTAIAPGLTAFFSEFGKFLSSHQADVTTFFGDVEHGIEWLTTPKNLSWLHEEADKALDTFKQIGHLAEELEHSVVFRRFFGLPVDPSAFEGGPSIGHGIATEDDGGAMERAIQGADGKPTLGARLWHYMFGGNASSGGSGGKLQTQLQSESDRTADAIGVPQAFARTIFGIEGGLNPDGSARTSSAGAVGAGQLMPGTAAQYGVTDPTNLQQNVHGSVAYMHKLLAQFHGNELAAAAAYNAGENNRGVQMFAQTGDPSMLPAETQKYVKDFARREAAYQDKSVAPDPVAASPTSSDAADRMAKLRVEIHHINPPAGARVSATTDSPGYINIDPPQVMGAMPTTGTQRNVAREGF